MSVKTRAFGKMDDHPISLFVLQNENDISIEITNYGGIVKAVHLPDRQGTVKNVALGFDNLDGYLAGHPYFGALVGRFANRIAHGRFELEGKTYTLACNEKGLNHLHGGNEGFDKKVWGAETEETADESRLVLSYTSPDGEEGFPGTLQVKVIYSLNTKNEFKIDYTATTDAATPVNLTNHTYWNLAGADGGAILNHELQLEPCNHFLPVNDELIPTGDIAPVAGTPLDFIKLKPINQDFEKIPSGYDHCYVIDRASDDLLRTAVVQDPESGRGLEVWTTKPGIQFYTGNFLDGIIGAEGAVFGPQSGFCLETQYYPDSVNHENFPSAILRPGQTYHHVTTHKFFIK